MKNIYLLTDYNNRFGLKYGDIPYRSGMDQQLLSSLFEKQGFDTIYMNYSKVQEVDEFKEVPILYTSTEDPGYHYKSYIEDIVLYLKIKGAKIIPRHEFLRANNNKSFMELFRKTFGDEEINSLKSWSFGSYKELKENVTIFDYPIVIKESAGAMSKGVHLATNKDNLIEIAKDISRSRFWLYEFKDYLRAVYYSNYERQSIYRKKFVTQSFISTLDRDYKILIFGDRYYIFERPTRKNDFRASGSGNQHYKYGSDVKYPEGIFNFAEKVFKSLNVPHLSLDIAYDGNQFYLIEFQAIYFGTVGQFKSDGYYSKKISKWLFEHKKLDLEKVYVDSIVSFLK